MSHCGSINPFDQEFLFQPFMQNLQKRREKNTQMLENLTAILYTYHNWRCNKRFAYPIGYDDSINMD